MYPGKQRTVQLLIQHGFASHVKDPLSAGRMQFQVKIFLPDKQSIQDQLTKNKYVYQIKLKHQGMISIRKFLRILGDDRCDPCDDGPCRDELTEVSTNVGSEWPLISTE